MVHWKATAHSGELMVREQEEQSAEPVQVDVVLPQGPEEAERMAERALGTVVALVSQGRPVLLCTDEAGGPRRGVVASRLAAGRRLASAVPRAESRLVPPSCPGARRPPVPRAEGRH
jgi:uncharacterized protein (DUF58 family)